MMEEVVIRFKTLTVVVNTVFWKCTLISFNGSSVNCTLDELLLGLEHARKELKRDGQANAD